MWATIVISLLLAAAVVGIIWNLCKKKKNGQGSCSCGCSNCGMSDLCHGKKK